MVSTRTTTGSIGVLARHAPLMAIPEPTELRLHKSEYEVVRFAQGEGYLQVVHNRVLVLVEDAICSSVARQGRRPGVGIPGPPSPSRLLLEQSLAEVKRRTKVIGRFPGETSYPTLVWAVLDLYIAHAKNGVRFNQLEHQHLHRIQHTGSETTTDEEVSAA